MAAPATVDEFFDLVRKSGVADEKRFDAYLQKNRAAIPPQPAEAAKVLVANGLITTFQAENILAGKWKRFSIGKYRILEKLGSGGMGQVFLCEHKLMRRRVAVKVLPTAKAKDPASLERFYREARAVAALDHPNIVHAYDIDQDEDLHFLVMEFVDGTNLHDLVKKIGMLDGARACHYVRQSALALQHAHEAGLVHRDIKPANILVDRSGVVKILDMGLARFFHDEDDVLTKKYDENVLGTADYLSPEQALDSHAVDIRADIYSLGATFYYLLTGKAPFESANTAQKLMMHQLRQPKAISDYRHDVPAGVLAIVQKMMEKDPNQRYATPGDLADALDEFTSEPIAAPTEAELPRLSSAATGQATSPGTSDSSKTNRDTPVAPAPAPVAKAIKPAPAAKAAPPPPPAAVLAPEVEPDAGLSAPSTEIEPWEKISSRSTETPARESSGEDSAAKKGAAKPARYSLVLILVLLLGVIPVCVVGVVGVLAWFFFPKPIPPPVPSGPPQLEVTRDPNRPQAYRTIQAALKAARIGSIIELRDEFHEESLVVNPEKGRTEITIRAAEGKTIVWRSPKPDEPIIKVYKGREFKLDGKGITLDGSVDAKRRVNELITITGDSPGLTIEDLELKSFARSAILVMNATGTSVQPIRLRRLTTTTDKSEKPRAAIYLDANPNVTPAPTDHVEITDCEFRGIPAKSAIAFPNAKVLGKNLAWPGR